MNREQILRKALRQIANSNADGWDPPGWISWAQGIARSALADTLLEPVEAACGCKVDLDLDGMRMGIVTPCNIRAHRDMAAGYRKAGIWRKK